MISSLPDPPSVSLHMTNKNEGESVREGETIVLKCSIDANPKPHTIKWTYQVGKKKRNSQ